MARPPGPAPHRLTAGRPRVFNVFNRAHFANPRVSNSGATFGTGAFGTISATRLTPREGQIGIRYLFQ